MQEDMNFDSTNPERTDFRSLEEALRSLRPRAGKIDRDQIMYLSGEQAARAGMTRSRRSWMLSTAGMSCVSFVICIMLVTGSGSNITPSGSSIVATGNSTTVAKKALPEQAGSAAEKMQPDKTGLPQPEVIVSEKSGTLRSSQPRSPHPSSPQGLGASDNLALLRWHLPQRLSHPNSYLALRNDALLGDLFDDSLSSNRLSGNIESNHTAVAPGEPSGGTSATDSDAPVHKIFTSRELLEQWLSENPSNG